MRLIKRNFMHFLITAMILLTAAADSGAAENSPLLPENLVIEDAYTPGFGLPAGKVLLVQGQAVIIHEDQTRGFYARANHLLFKGDTLVTLNRGRVRIQLADDSIITLASETRLVINKSVFDPDGKVRSSFVGMDQGKARFLIQKLVDFKQSDFTAKTKTAVAGVRGSEFIIASTNMSTEIMTLADTRLEVISLVSPCKDFKEFPPPPECRVKPVILADFEKTTVRLGELPTPPEAVAPEEAAELEKEFVIVPDMIAPESPVEGESQQDDMQLGIFMAPEDIPEPETFMDLPQIEMPPAFSELSQVQPEVNLSEAIIDNIMTDSLPGFPGTPQ